MLFRLRPTKGKSAVAMKDYILRELFREPRHGWRSWMVLFAGCAATVSFFFAIQDETFRLVVLFLSVALVLRGAAETVPKDWTALAALLRTGHGAAMFAMIV